MADGRQVPAEWTSSHPRAQRAQQAADTLRGQISAGVFVEGVLPDERSLAADLGASRNAVRDALALLREEGLIERRQGVGTTVSTPKYGHGLDRLAGLAEALSGYGTVVNVVRGARLMTPAPATVAEQLELAPDAGVVHVERLRRLGGSPLSLDETYLARDVGEPLLGCDLAGRDLFALIEDTAGLQLGRAEVTVDAATADAEIAGLLEIEPGSAMFAIHRLTRLQDGRPIDVEWIHIRADRLSLHATLHRATSARASPIVLPISNVTDCAISSERADNRSRSSNNFRARPIADTPRHAGNAARAAATAASRSARPDNGTRATTTPDAGATTSNAPVAAPAGVHTPAT
jgi:GntR family transcriptional regulator